MESRTKIEPILVSERQVALMFAVHVRKVKELARVGLLTSRGTGRINIYYRNEITSLLDKIFYEKNFPNNFTDETQKGVVIQIFMNEAQRTEYLINSIEKQNEQRKLSKNDRRLHKSQPH